jgi:DNA invertase Pin-like site-specific DNA recombinase
MIVGPRSQDTASQEPDLKRWAEGQNSPVIWFRDKFTGKTMDRPGWNKLTQSIEAGKESAIVV